MQQDFIERHLTHISPLSFLLFPFSLVFLFLQICHRFFAQYKKRYKSSLTVISVGNITTGGSGKTPFTIFLAEKIKAAGFYVAVSHRGYKGKFENSEMIISDEMKLRPEAEDAGDEALLLAEKLKGIPVVAGKNRKKALELLACNFPELQVVILDDSFQHLDVYHDYDFLLFSDQVGIGNGFLIPAGILREPLSAVKHADCLVYNGEEVLPFLKKYQKDELKIYTEIEGIFLSNRERINPVDLENAVIALVSGIGNPSAFENTVKEARLDFNTHLRFPDHHQYSDKDFEKIDSLICRSKIDYLITTEKDFTKLRKRNFKCHLLVLRIKYNSRVNPISFLKHDLKE